jgi:hypothetical protein
MSAVLYTCQNIVHFIQALQCPTNSMWKRTVGTRQEVNTEHRKFNICWMVSVVHMLYFTFVLNCGYFCSFVWYSTPIIEVFCLLLFSVLFIFINSLWLNSVLLRLECICRTNSSHRKFYCSHTWPDYTLRNICVTNDHVYHSFVELTIRSFSL